MSNQLSFVKINLKSRIKYKIVLLSSYKTEPKKEKQISEQKEVMHVQ